MPNFFNKVKFFLAATKMTALFGATNVYLFYCISYEGASRFHYDIITASERGLYIDPRAIVFPNFPSKIDIIPPPMIRQFFFLMRSLLICDPFSSIFTLLTKVFP